MMAQSGIKAHEGFEELLPFERLLTEISTLFINLPADRIDNEIKAAQRRICEFLDIDRSTLWITSEDDPGTLLLTHSHQLPGIPSPSERMSTKDFFPWTAQKVLDGETLAISKMTELPAKAGRDRESFSLYGSKSGVYVPLSVGKGPVFGVLAFAVTRDERDWPKRVVQQFQLVAEIFANALARKRADEQLKKQLEEIEELKQRLEKENICLREELGQEKSFGKIIGNSEALKYVLFRVRQVAPTDATVLILGETGTGKGMVANGIHGLSSRKERPIITVNCAALPANLIESELFGREKGAFTGAHTRQSGRFEAADGGTIFLDEIGELPLDLQSKLLRVLQDGEFERLGSAKTVKVDVRVIASTSRDLKEEVGAGNFREDLFYRLNVFPVTIPPLRERADDIPELVRFFADKYSRKIGKQIETIPKLAMKAMQEYSWPGNVRELEHVIERSVITTGGTVLQLVDRLEPIRGAEAVDSSPRELAAMEREHIVRVLRDTGWKIEGRKGAAKILNLHPSTLRSRIKKLGIIRP
jgi:formate hydrogenlyase transcriptional activator